MARKTEMKKRKTKTNERKGNECLELVSVIRIYKYYIYTVATKIIRPPNKKVLFVLFLQDERSYRSEDFIMP